MYLEISIGAAIGCLVGWFVGNFVLTMRLNKVERGLFELRQAEKSVKGVAARENLDEEIELAIPELIAKFQSGEKLDVQGIVGVLGKYPTLRKKAMRAVGI